MRLLPIQQCKPGMKLARCIYSEEGNVLLNQYAELTASILRRLEQYGFDYLYIADARTDDIVPSEPISEETRTRAVGEIRTNFRRMMDTSARKMSVGSLQLGKTFRSLLNTIIDDISSHKDAMIMLTNINLVDHYLYQHSLNVCIYTTLLAMAQGFSREELNVIGLGALLHDIGKVHIPLEVLNKPGKLNQAEFSAMQQHAEIGYRLLKDEPNIPLLSAHCAFQHHERIDGSGYPRGIKGEEIHEFARWIGVVDSYDAMTSHRVYRRAMLPHQALEILYTGSGTLYDQAKIELFRDKVAIYPLGSTVTLNTGERGVVVDLNATLPHRPVIRILEDADGQDVTVPYEIDLSKKLTVLISSVNDVKVEQGFEAVAASE